MNQHFFRHRLRRAVWALVLFALLLGRAHAQVGLPPSITVQPVDQVALNGDTVQFSVVASSLTALSYQWYFGAAPIGGATASLLTLTGVDTNDTGGYHVEVRNLVGMVNSRTALLTVLLSNDVPVARDDAYTMAEDTTLIIPTAGVLTNDTDVYPGGLSAVLVSNPANGVLTFSNNGSFTYRPNTNFTGLDTFTYRATDGQKTILEQNASGGSAKEVDRGTGSQSFRHGTAGDPDYSIKKLVLRLSKRSGEASNLNFSLGTGLNSGPVAGSSHAIAMASISNVTQGASFQTYNLVYSTPVGPFTAGTAYHLNFENASTAGRKVWLEYTSSNSYPRGTYYENGTNAGGDIRFEIYDYVGSAIATTTIQVSPVNDAPVAVNDSASTPEDTSVTIKVLLNDVNVDGGVLKLASVTTTNGTAAVSGSGTNVVFTPATNFNGTAVLFYTMTNAAGFATGLVTVTVSPVNDAPSAVPDTANVEEDASVIIRVLANDTDVEGTALSLVSASTTNGTAVLSGTNILFTPATNYFGTVAFTYRASDGGKFATGTVTVVITPVNDAPVAGTNLYTTEEDVPLNIPAPGILADDSDVDGDPFTALLVSDVANGSLVLNDDGSFTYTPAADFSGSDSFSYRGKDGLALGNVATVTIIVTPVPDALRFVSQQGVSNGLRLELSGPRASFYVLQTSSNFTDWTSISTNFAPYGNLVCTNPMAGNRSVGLYRALTVAPMNLQQNALGGAKVEIDPDLPGAQSFHLGTNGGPAYGLSKIVIRISRDGPLAPDGNLIFSLGTGVNSGPIAGSTLAITPGSVTNSTGGTNFQRYEIVLPEPIGPLTAGTTYYLNFVSQSTNGEDYWLERSWGISTYAPGTLYSAGGDMGRDMRFELWGQ